MACVAAHYEPVLSRRGTRQLPAWSVQDETVVPFALHQRGAERRSQGPFPVWPHAWRWSPSSGHPRLPGVGTDSPLAVTHLRVRTLRDVETTEHGLDLAHRRLPAAPCAYTIRLAGHRLPPTHVLPS